MIEKMKELFLVAPANKKEEMLLKIRELGIIHLKEKKNASENLIKNFNSVTKVYQILKESKNASASLEKNKILTDEEFNSFNLKVTEAIDNKKNYLSEISKLGIIRDNLVKWGDFNIALIKELKDSGYNFYIYTLSKKDYNEIKKSKEIKFVLLKSVDKQITVAVLHDRLSSNIIASEFIIPDKSLSDINSEIDKYKKLVKEADMIIKEATSYLSLYKKQISKCINDINFSSAENSTNSDSDLVWISGYIPQSEIDNFKSISLNEKWAYALGEVKEDDDFVPTKVKYSKITKIIKPVFDILGTVPGYREYDISFWFLCFFSLFFAMIIGDAGYGFCFLFVGVILNLKSKKVTDTVLLIYVVSISTIVWGGITGTWFGLESAMRIPFFKMFVIKSIASYPEYFGNTALNQQNTIMKFCFLIGMIQLVLACLINIKRKIKEKNLSFIADIGWMSSIVALYFVILLLVIGEEVNIKISAIMVGIGFVFVTLFGGMNPKLSFIQGLKAGLAGVFTNFLNTISSFGNIMSYIRLFAVGLASLAIAQSFNDMALSLNGFMKIFGYVIFVLGHTLNLVMGLLSVVVHGVRLNLLEFSGQLGMEWSGIEYDPFRIKDGGVK